jgi:hypothetical protein
MVNFKVSIGDKLKLVLISKFTGVPMGVLQKFWEFMNGKKTVVGLVITALAKVALVVPALFAVFGASAQAGVVVGVITAVVGVGHKIYKFLYHEDLP